MSLSFFAKKKSIESFYPVIELFKDKKGVEIGGPSHIFGKRGFIPLYPQVAALDACNFSGNTIWEGHIQEGLTYKFHNKIGKQYLLEASNLSDIPSNKYDFLISSNCLEHLANPLKALQEWIRVVGKHGLILLLLPNKEFTFDHKREVTSFAHLIQDFENRTTEEDLTHLDEILRLHDLTMDKGAGTKEQFKERSLKNFDNRALHHHVFDTALLKQMFDHFSMETLFIHVENKNHIILGRVSD